MDLFFLLLCALGGAVGATVLRTVWRRAAARRFRRQWITDDAWQHLQRRARGIS